MIVKCKGNGSPGLSERISIRIPGGNSNGRTGRRQRAGYIANHDGIAGANRVCHKIGRTAGV